MNVSNKIFFDALVRFLGSLKLSFVLLLLLGALAAQKAIMAQKAIDMEDEPWFLTALNTLGGISPEAVSTLLMVVLGLFVINLLLSSVKMVKKVRGRQEAFKRLKTAREISRLADHAVITVTGDPSDRLIAFFAGRGLKVTGEQGPEGIRLHAGKRQAGLWGGFFFHLTFMIVLVGALLSTLTRYAGYIALSPGDIFVEKRSGYMRVTDRPLLFGRDRLFRLRLDNIDVSYWKPGLAKQRANIVTLFAADGTDLGRQRMEINHPLHVDGVTVYQGTRQGFVADLHVTDRAGTTVKARARFRFPEQPGERMTSSITLPGTEVTLLMELFTEKIREIQGLERFFPNHIATLIKVSSVERGAPVFRGVVFRGTALSFEGLTVGFDDLKPYSSFVVKRDYGVPVIFASFISLLLGLIVAYYWVPENWWAACERNEEEGYRITIGAVTERYSETFAERFAEQVEALQSEVRKT
ncbi:cytochrome c biogenesis protein ResB [Geobacter argillaceus]|uniref:Cytochrome c biogenesis protein ResB n=1 Tax=Geobacter argillaceus TaxID=345631 RepID=A0A562V986_9BACT|nr:cytochrome c biogenesis protein ResB [Geobacter argillaceus]TWJ14297.1 cytochrome c biogenesis protein ResB [Geobacter argillaceus]